MRHRFGVEEEPMAEMNFIPLIDIALTLVVILMVTTVFIRNPGIAMKLPETATREGAPEKPRDLVLAVTRDGVTHLDGKPAADDEVRGALRAYAAKEKQGRVLVKGDRDAAHGAVIHVVDMVRQAGISRVVLPTDPLPPPVQE